MGWGPWPALSAGVYGIRYAWNTSDLTEGFSHVFPTAPLVCGFIQILWVSVCLSLRILCTVRVCCQTMHDWPKTHTICDGMSGPEMERRGSEADEKQRWKDKGRESSLGQWWRTYCAACCIRQAHHTDLMTWCIKETSLVVSPRLYLWFQKKNKQTGELVTKITGSQANVRDIFEF